MTKQNEKLIRRYNKKSTNLNMERTFNSWKIRLMLTLSWQLSISCEKIFKEISNLHSKKLKEKNKWWFEFRITFQWEIPCNKHKMSSKCHIYIFLKVSCNVFHSPHFSYHHRDHELIHSLKIVMTWFFISTLILNLNRSLMWIQFSLTKKKKKTATATATPKNEKSLLFIFIYFCCCTKQDLTSLPMLYLKCN